MSILQPPPKHSASNSRVATPSPDPTWKDKMKATGMRWGKTAGDKAIKVNDYLGPKVNSFAETRFGTHAFWPVSGDFPAEMEKAAVILREFTVSGVVQTDKSTKRKVLRKVPPSVLASAEGLAIFTSMRSGIAPLGGAGGAGIVVGRLPDGSWSPPASISPQNLSTGFLIGIDVYDCILVIRTRKALESFYSHKVTLGTEIGVAAGPYGAGAAVEAGREAAPVFSYIKSRGMYAGVEVVGQVFASRFDENGQMYNWPGIKASDILTGKVKMPREAAALMEALDDAASGRAQVKKGQQLDVPVDELASSVELEDGEVLKLPPTPEMTDGREYESDPETENVIRRSRPPSLPPRSQHNNSVPPPLPPRNPRRSDEFMPSPLGESASMPASPRTAAPPLPPRSRARPQSMLVSPSALKFSPPSPVAAVDASSASITTVPAEAPPSYDESERSPVGESSALPDAKANYLAPPAPLSPASSASVYEDSPLAELADLNLGALEAGAPRSGHAPPIPFLPPSHGTVGHVPEPSPALTVPGEKYSLGPSVSSTRLSSYHSTEQSATAEGSAQGNIGLLAGTVDGEEMSESERREWEQHFEAERRRAAEVNDKGKAREDESLL